MSNLFELGTTLNGKTICPKKGIYPAFGGNGIIDFVEEYNYPENTIIIGRVGANCGSVYFSETKCWVTDNALAFITNKKNYPYYIYYLLKHINLNKYHIGSSQPLITQSIINNINIANIPNLENQKAIGNFLRIIDAKIYINNEINSKLESLAKTIYDYWFLQFEFPNEEGKPYKSSGGKMVWNKELKREIPEGWEVKKIKDFSTLSRGISYTAKDLSTCGTPIISLASISRNGNYIPDAIKYYKGNVPENKKIKKFDLVMCNTDMTQEREVIAKCIMVPDIFETQVTHTHHITKIDLISDNLKSYFVSTTQSKWFHEYVKGFSSGTNVLGLDSKAFEKISIIIPENYILDKYHKIFIAMEKEISTIIKQNQQLASLRDWLLPMLMNGQVTFKE